MIHRNDPFLCLYCQKENHPQKGSCRNHCRFCLYSRHVDANIPGDRASTCHGLMAPTGLEYSGKKGYMIIHTCLKCQKIIPNKSAPDDNFEEIVKLTIRNP